MDLVKSAWQQDGDNDIRLQMPITKYDTEKRLVSGFATLDNVDQHDDQVLKEASAKAFKEFRGNLREMHQPIAAGKLVDIKEQEFYDPKTAQKYVGIYVTAYVSKGAQATWEKVLDGTLTGFSIGGSIGDSYTEFNKSVNKNIRIIKEYSLTELSLVDSPANQLSNVFSFAKDLEGHSFIKGMIANTEIVNVFWCDNDEIAKQSNKNSEVCFNCNNNMEQIGWFEKGADEDTSVRETIEKYLNKTEGGVINKMADEITNEHVVDNDKVDEQKEENATVEVSTEENTAPATKEDVSTTAKPEADPEVHDTLQDPNEGPEFNEDTPTTSGASAGEGDFNEASTEPDFEKMFGALENAVKEQLQKSKTDVQKAVETVESKIEEVNKSFEEKTGEISKQLESLGNKLEEVKTEREGVEKRLNTLEGRTAIKKSNESDGDDTPAGKTEIKKGLWSGSILSD